MEAFRTRFGDVVEFTRDFLIGPAPNDATYNLQLTTGSQL